MYTILLSDHTGSCCRSSSNTGVSCDATGVVSNWLESTQCGCGLWAIQHWPHHNPVKYFSTTRALEVIFSDDPIRFYWRTPAEINWWRSHSNFFESSWWWLRFYKQWRKWRKTFSKLCSNVAGNSFSLFMLSMYLWFQPKLFTIQKINIALILQPLAEQGAVHIFVQLE